MTWSMKMLPVANMISPSRIFLKRYADLKIQGVEYKGKLLRINDTQTYFSATMALLDERTRQDLFWSGLPVFTKVKG